MRCGSALHPGKFVQIDVASGDDDADPRSGKDRLVLQVRGERRRARLIHESVRGSRHVSIKYTERLAEAGIEPSVGSVGDSYDCEDPFAGSSPVLRCFASSLPWVV